METRERDRIQLSSEEGGMTEMAEGDEFSGVEGIEGRLCSGAMMVMGCGGGGR